MLFEFLSKPVRSGGCDAQRAFLVKFCFERKYKIGDGVQSADIVSIRCWHATPQQRGSVAFLCDAIRAGLLHCVESIYARSGLRAGLQLRGRTRGNRQDAYRIAARVLDAALNFLVAATTRYDLQHVKKCAAFTRRIFSFEPISERQIKSEITLERLLSSALCRVRG